MHRVGFHHVDAHDQHEDEGYQVPAHGGVGIAAHEAVVDVFGAGDYVVGVGLGGTGG